MKKSELKSIVEQKVDEAWYNNKNDFYRGLGKVTTAGILGTAGVAAGLGVLDRGLQNGERYEQSLNREAASNTIGTETNYQKWCQENGADPNDRVARSDYEQWVNDELKESIINKLTRIVSEDVKRQIMSLNE